MTGQSKKASAVEAFLNGIYASTSEHLMIGALFTIVSLVRSYFLRRFFNWLMVRGA